MSISCFVKTVKRLLFHFFHSELIHVNILRILEKIFRDTFPQVSHYQFLTIKCTDLSAPNNNLNKVKLKNHVSRKHYSAVIT